MPPITVDETEAAGGEPARPHAALALEAREPQRATFPFAAARVVPVLQRSSKVGQAGRIGFFGVFAPPRRNSVLGPVPVLAQAVCRPVQVRGELVTFQTVRPLGLPLIHVRLHPRETPVVGEPLRTAVRPQRGFMLRVWIERELVCLDDRAHAVGSRAAHRAAASARRCAQRRPYSRAHIEVSTSTMSRTRSSSLTSSVLSTTRRRPVADSAASRCSVPNRANRSRCSTTIVDTFRSARSFRRLTRFSFSPG